MSCPNCASPLHPLVRTSPSIPPWTCTACSRGWWEAELTLAARQSWDPTSRSHGMSEAGQMVRLSVQVELDTARRNFNNQQGV